MCLIGIIYLKSSFGRLKYIHRLVALNNKSTQVHFFGFFGFDILQVYLHFQNFFSETKKESKIRTLFKQKLFKNKNSSQILMYIVFYIFLSQFILMTTFIIKLSSC